SVQNLSNRRIRRYLVCRLKRPEARDFSHVGFTNKGRTASLFALFTGISMLAMFFFNAKESSAIFYALYLSLRTA
ncbi:hypothetical protein DXD02_14625, partial [Blautia sp. TF10-30]